MFIGCYALLLFQNLTWAMMLGLPALFVRQIGHAIFEPPCHDKEELLLGFTTRSKTAVVAVYLAIPVLHAWQGTFAQGTGAAADAIAMHWFYWTLAVVGGHVAYLIWNFGMRNSMIWLVKLATDPITDIITYRPHLASR